MRGSNKIMISFLSLSSQYHFTLQRWDKTRLKRHHTHFRPHPLIRECGTLRQRPVEGDVSGSCGQIHCKHPLQAAGLHRGRQNWVSQKIDTYYWFSFASNIHNVPACSHAHKRHKNCCIAYGVTEIQSEQAKSQYLMVLSQCAFPLGSKVLMS